jgi:FkbM family methyltransferase
LKKLIAETIHSIFRIRFFENLLHPIVKDKYVNHSLVKFIPPNHTYKKGTYRLVKKDKLILHADLFDYNDWKAFWGLKEVERENLYKLSRKATVAVDVGANNGWVLMNLSSIVERNKGFVYGFEPYPETYERCMKNLEDSHITNCQLFNRGCGENEGELMMVVEKQSNSGQNRIVRDEKISFSEEKNFKVVLTTLDKQLGSVGRIDLIKIDVEGFELNVLKGGVELLEKYRPVIFLEIDDKLLKANDTSPAEVLSFLRERYGYMFTNAFSGKKVNISDDFLDRHLDVICRYQEN